jgi:hypothetical protein
MYVDIFVAQEAGFGGDVLLCPTTIRGSAIAGIGYEEKNRDLGT